MLIDGNQTAAAHMTCGNMLKFDRDQRPAFGYDDSIVSCPIAPWEPSCDLVDARGFASEFEPRPASQGTSHYRVSATTTSHITQLNGHNKQIERGDSTEIKCKKANINDSKKVLCSINDIADKRKQTKIIIILIRWWWWWWCALVARSFRLRIFVYAIAAHQTADIIILSCHLRLILFFSWQTRKWRPLAFHMINHRNALTRYIRHGNTYKILYCHLIWQHNSGAQH